MQDAAQAIIKEHNSDEPPVFENQDSETSSVQKNDPNWIEEEGLNRKPGVGKRVHFGGTNLLQTKHMSKKPEKYQKTEAVLLQDMMFDWAHVMAHTHYEAGKAHTSAYVNKNLQGQEELRKAAAQQAVLSDELLAEVQIMIDFYKGQFTEGYEHKEAKQYMPMLVYQNIKVKCGQKTKKFLTTLRQTLPYLKSSIGLWQHIKQHRFEDSIHWDHDETVMMHPSYYKIKILRQLITYDWSTDHWALQQFEVPAGLASHHNAISSLNNQGDVAQVEIKPKYRDPKFCCSWIQPRDLNSTSLNAKDKELVAYLYNKERATVEEKYQLQMLGMVHPKLKPILGSDQGTYETVSHLVQSLPPKELFISLMLHKCEIKAYIADNPSEARHVIVQILEAIGKQTRTEHDYACDGGISYFIGELIIAVPSAMDDVGTAHFELFMEHLCSPFLDQKDLDLECNTLTRLLHNHLNLVSKSINKVYHGRIPLEYRKVLISTWPNFMKPNVLLEMEHQNAPTMMLTKLLVLITKPPEQNFKLQTLETWLLKYKKFLEPMIVAWTANGIKMDYIILQNMIEGYQKLQKLENADLPQIMRELMLKPQPHDVILKMSAIGESNTQHTTPAQETELKEKLKRFLLDHNILGNLEQIHAMVKSEESTKKMAGIGRIMRKWQELICKTILALMVRFNLCDLIVVPPGYGKTIVILHTANLIVENHDMRVVIVCTNEMQINQARYFYNCGYQQWNEGSSWPKSQPVKYILPDQLDHLQSWIKANKLEDQIVVIVDEVDQVVCEGNLEDDQKWALEGGVQHIKAKFSFKQFHLMGFSNILMLTGTAEERLGACLNEIGYNFMKLECPNFNTDCVTETIYYNPRVTYTDVNEQHKRVLEIFKERFHLQPLIVIIPKRPESGRLQFLHDAKYKPEYVLDSTRNSFIQNQTGFERMKLISKEHCLVIVAEAARGLDCEYAVSAYVINMVRPETAAAEKQYATRSSRDSRHQSHCEHVLIGNPICPIQKQIDHQCSLGTPRREALSVLETAVQSDLIWKLQASRKLHNQRLDVNMVFRVAFYQMMDSPDMVYYSERDSPDNVRPQMLRFKIFRDYLNLRPDVLPSTFVGPATVIQLQIKKSHRNIASGGASPNTIPSSAIGESHEDR